MLLTTIEPEELKEMLAGLIQEELKKFFTPPQNDDTLLTRKEVARLLGISLPTLSNHVKNGTIKAYRMGCKVFFKKGEVLNSLKEIQSIKYKNQSKSLTIKN